MRIFGRWKSWKSLLQHSPKDDVNKCFVNSMNVCCMLSGQFSIPLPFRTSVLNDTFAGSREVVIKRFEALTSKLSENPQLKLLYMHIISDYIALEHMSISRTPGCFFIPHYAVYRPEVDATKIRIVFNASVCNYKSPSFNSCLLPGPKL